MFKITKDYMRQQHGRGFQVTFSNGVTLSVQFGYGTYCTNREGNMTDANGDTQSPDAEIAMFDSSGDWITKKALIATGIDTDPGDDVKGYVTPDQVALLMAWGVMYGRNAVPQALEESSESFSN